MLSMDLASTAHSSHLAQRLGRFGPPLRHTVSTEVLQDVVLLCSMCPVTT